MDSSLDEKVGRDLTPAELLLIRDVKAIKNGYEDIKTGERWDLNGTYLGGGQDL